MTIARLALAVGSIAALLCAQLRPDPPGSRPVELELTDDRLALVPLDNATGPESFAFDGLGGGPYTGVSGGRVLRWRPEERRWAEHATLAPPHLARRCRASDEPSSEQECGRPLGMQFNAKTGDLYVANSDLGLRVVAPSADAATPAVTRVGSAPLRFTNGVDVDEETGIVYFTDSSRTFKRREFTSLVLSGDSSGRLMKYDPASNRVEVLLDGLSFANGVALSEDGSFLLVVETTTGRILRYWLKTASSSTVEVVAQLSGYPDNIRRSPRGGFWVGMCCKGPRLVQWALSCPLLRQFLLKIPLDYSRVFSMVNRHGRSVVALRLNDDGDVVEVLRGDARGKLRCVSEVAEKEGVLWIGSVRLPFAGLYRLP